MPASMSYAPPEIATPAAQAAPGEAAQAVSVTGPAPGAAAQAVPATGAAPGRVKRPRCEDCFFGVNGLCALRERKPCPTFRPAHPDGLRPPQQLSFVFRQERRAEPFAFAPAQAWV